jgi:hypothetical protein
MANQTHIMSPTERQHLIADVLRWGNDCIFKNSGWAHSARCFYDFFNEDIRHTDQTLIDEIYANLTPEVQTKFLHLIADAKCFYFERCLSRIRDDEFDAIEFSPKVGWACETSPTKFCEYDYQENSEYCIHCGLPYERK